MPLPPEHLLDELATAYIQALAALAGATIAVSRRDYGVDGTLSKLSRCVPLKGCDLFLPGFRWTFS